MTFTPRTWSVGEVVSAAQLNTEIRNQFNSIITAWTAYTPTWTAVTTNPVLGNGSLVGQHMKIGRTCHVTFNLTMGSTTTYGSGFWRISLPFTAATVASGSPGVLNYTYSRSANPNFTLGAGPIGSGASNTDNIWLPSLTDMGDYNVITGSSPWVPAAGEVLRGYGTYQTAA
ncbi:hypothetical protein [Streptomyces uncialis]|uniref:hypothetical protein n=1 Tax=Streptomyces uncialis TaxID=1048205 RepID=UPI0033C919E5